jgi:hypothetical protein
MNTDKKEWAREHLRREWGRTKKLCKQACPIFASFLPIPVGGHLKCTTRGHFKMHHFSTV